MKRLLIGLFACLLWSQSAWAVLSISNSSVNAGDATIVANAGDVVVITVPFFNVTSSDFISSLSLSNGQSLIKRAAITPYNASGFFVMMEEWYLVATVPIINETTIITFNAGSTNYSTFSVSISGANITTPFDTNVSLPALGSNMTASVAPSLSISTTNANTILLGALIFSAASSADPGTGYTDYGYVSHLLSSDGEYQIVSATQSSKAVNWGTSSTNSNAMGMIADAIQAAGGGAAAPKLRSLMGVGQ